MPSAGRALDDVALPTVLPTFRAADTRNKLSRDFVAGQRIAVMEDCRLLQFDHFTVFPDCPTGLLIALNTKKAVWRNTLRLTLSRRATIVSTSDAPE
jgi:hypothetical protein